MGKHNSHFCRKKKYVSCLQMVWGICAFLAIYLEKDLIVLALSTQTNRIFCATNPKSFAPIIDGFGQHRVLKIEKKILHQFFMHNDSKSWGKVEKKLFDEHD